MSALAVTDHGLVGAIRFYQRACSAGLKPILGTEIVLEGGHHLTLLARNGQGYAHLCRLVSTANLRDPTRKQEPFVTKQELATFSAGLIALSGCARGEVPSLLTQGRKEEALAAARWYRDVFEGDFCLELINHIYPDTSTPIRGLVELAQHLQIPMVATNNVHYARFGGHRLHEVLSCIRANTTLAAYPFPRTTEAYLKSPRQMAVLFRQVPQAIQQSERLAERCDVTLELGRLHVPRFPVPEGETSYSYLCSLAFAGAQRLYKPLRHAVLKRLEEELAIINELGMCDYFLLVWDVVRWAREQGIRCSGRGSGADSLVCYCLDITRVDPLAHHLPFGRFLSLERRDPPDIDLDFDSTRRDEVFDYIFQKYGPERAAMVCTVNTFRARGAVRQVAKVLGYSPHEIDLLARELPHMRASDLRAAYETLPELRDSGLNLEHHRLLFDLCEQMDGLPHHLAVHVGGVIVGDGPLADRLPLQWANKGVIIAQRDKDDVEATGDIKLDVLGVRMLSAIQYAVDLLRKRGEPVDVDTLPLDDPAVFKLLRSTHTLGIFQLESPGQRELQGRLQPERYFDIVCAVALFRPGPVAGGMVEPFIRRRWGQEPVTYPHPSLEPILKDTFGLILFQEQVLEVAAVIAGFTHGEADQLRRAMTHDRSEEEMARIGETFMSRATAKGTDPKTAERVFAAIRGFAAYGFCRAHAAAFAFIAYQSAYLKAHYPAEFFAGVLTHMPGFYPAHTLLAEARRCGVGVLPLDINHSEATYTVEDGKLRIPLSQVRGVPRGAIDSILAARKEGGRFVSLEDFLARTMVPRPALENLVLAGAFDSLCRDRRSLLWRLPRALDSRHGPALLELRDEEDRPPCHADEELAMELDILGLSLGAHPLDMHMEFLRRMRAVDSRRLARLEDGTAVTVAGLVIARMTPPTKSGQRVIFLTLEDREGLVDVAVFPAVQERYGRAACFGAVVIVRGTVRRRGKRGVSVTAESVIALGNDDSLTQRPT